MNKNFVNILRAVAKSLFNWVLGYRYSIALLILTCLVLFGFFSIIRINSDLKTLPFISHVRGEDYEKNTLSKQPTKSFRAVPKNTNTSPYGYYEFKPEGYDDPDPDNERKYPLIIYLHGSGESGDGSLGDLPKVLRWGLPKMCSNGTFNENFIVLSPQWLDNAHQKAYDETLLFDFIEYVKREYDKVDESRIYLTGISAGGWYLSYYLEKFPTTHGIAASVPISTVLEDGYTTAAGISASNCPTWLISNIGDPVVPWDDNHSVSAGHPTVVRMRYDINAIRPNMIERLTGFNNATHEGTWDGIFDSSLIGSADPNYDPFDESIYKWLLRHAI